MHPGIAHATIANRQVQAAPAAVTGPAVDSYTRVLEELTGRGFCTVTVFWYPGVVLALGLRR